jgi:hypothetical protein
MSGCYYLTWGGQAFGLTQLIPIGISLCLTVLSAATNQFIYFLYAWFLYFPMYIAFVMQYYFQWVRMDPICGLYASWAFPSTAVLYTYSIVGAFLAYFKFWNRVNHSWVVWLCIYLLALLPPFIVWYNNFNTLFEIAMTALFGFTFSFAFFVIARYFLRPNMGYLKCHFFFLNYDDSIMWDKEYSKLDREIWESLKWLENLKNKNQ